MIRPGEKYKEQRCAYDGTAYAFRFHHECGAAYRSWNVPDDETYDLADLSEGHLPPCPRAWDGQEDHACTCKAKP